MQSAHHNTGQVVKVQADIIFPLYMGLKSKRPVTSAISFTENKNGEPFRKTKHEVRTNKNFRSSIARTRYSFTLSIFLPVSSQLHTSISTQLCSVPRCSKS